MGVACGDLDGDGRLDLAVTNFLRRVDHVFPQPGPRTVRRPHAAVGLAAPTRYLLGFGIAFLDANNDGRLDLLTANGHVNDYRPASPSDARPAADAGAEGRLTDVSRRAAALPAAPPGPRPGRRRPGQRRAG